MTDVVVTVEPVYQEKSVPMVRVSVNQIATVPSVVLMVVVVFVDCVKKDSPAH